jgi:hypothetical protein
MEPQRIFLLSPARTDGKRAALLLRPDAVFDLAMQLRSTLGAPLGEVFGFLSGLYFRGKMTYAARFSGPPHGGPGALVITSSRGLMLPEARVSPRDLAEFASVPIDLREPRYREPLARDVARLADAAPAGCRFVLLGSVATAKYVELLLDLLGPRLFVPEAFPGMGDMQRGALMLRAAREGVELLYQPVAGAVLSRAAARKTRR